MPKLAWFLIFVIGAFLVHILGVTPTFMYALGFICLITVPVLVALAWRNND